MATYYAKDSNLSITINDEAHWTLRDGCVDCLEASMGVISDAGCSEPVTGTGSGTISEEIRSYAYCFPQERLESQLLEFASELEKLGF